MTVTVDATSSSVENDTTNSLSWAHTVAAGATLLLVSVSYFSGTATETLPVKYGGVALTPLGSPQQVDTGAAGGYVQVYGLANPAAGTANVTVDGSALTGPPYAPTGDPGINGIAMSSLGGPASLPSVASSQNDSSPASYTSTAPSGGLNVLFIALGDPANSITPTPLVSSLGNSDWSSGEQYLVVIAGDGTAKTATITGDPTGVVQIAIAPSSAADAGTATVTAGKPSVSATGTQKDTGTAAAALTRPTVGATGTQKDAGTAAAAAPAPTAAASGTLTLTGTAQILLPAELLTAAGTQTVDGTAAAAAASPDIAATGTQTDAGEASATAPAPTAAAADTPSDQGTVSAALPAPLAAATGTQAVTGQIAITLPAEALQAAATSTMTGTVAIAIPAPTASAAAGNINTGTAIVTVASPDVAGTGTQTVIGSVQLGLPGPVVAAIAGGLLAGDIHIELPGLSAAAAGTQTDAATAAASLPLPTVVVLEHGTMTPWPDVATLIQQDTRPILTFIPNRPSLEQI